MGTEVTCYGYIGAFNEHHNIYFLGEMRKKFYLDTPLIHSYVYTLPGQGLLFSRMLCPQDHLYMYLGSILFGTVNQHQHEIIFIMY